MNLAQAISSPEGNCLYKYKEPQINPPLTNCYSEVSTSQPWVQVTLFQNSCDKRKLTKTVSRELVKGKIKQLVHPLPQHVKKAKNQN
jgi:hypothetical protein